VLQHLGAICLAVAAQQAQPWLLGPLDRTSVVNSNILNSEGAHVGVVVGQEVFGLKGQKLYDLKGSNIYKLNGDLVGHLSDARGAEKRLDKATDKLFPSTRFAEFSMKQFPAVGIPPFSRLLVAEHSRAWSSSEAIDYPTSSLDRALAIHDVRPGNTSPHAR
jgi:hypothetical protein